jgi:hypothetical protein
MARDDRLYHPNGELIGSDDEEMNARLVAGSFLTPKPSYTRLKKEREGEKTQAAQPHEDSRKTSFPIEESNRQNGDVGRNAGKQDPVRFRLN